MERDNMKSIKRQLIRIEGRILTSTAYANYYANYATSETNHSRKVYKGFSDIALTKEELESEAFKTALSFIHNIEEFTEEKIKLTEMLNERM